MTITRVIHTPEGFEAPEAIVHTRESSEHLNEPTSRVYDGGVRYTVGQDDAQHETSARYVHSTAGTAGGSIIDTLTATFGRPSVETRPGDPSSRTDVRTAERMGVIRSNGRGGWEAVTNAAGQQQTLASIEAAEQQAAQQQAQQQAAKTAADTAGVFLPAEDAHFAAIASDIPEHAFRSTAAAITNAVVLDQGLEAAAQRLATTTGMEPAEAMERVTALVELQQNVVDRAMGKVGLQGDDLAEFYAHAMEQPGRLQNALQFLVHGRDVSQFQAWGREFAEKQGLRAVVEQARSVSTDELANPMPQKLKAGAGGQRASVFEAAGFETSRDAAGTLMVRREGGSWQPATAVLKPAAPAPQPPALSRRAPTSHEAAEAWARKQHSLETDLRLLRNSGFETKVDVAGAVFARKGHGEWKSADDIFGKA